MVKALFDTNILTDYLNAFPEARRELQRYTEKAVSIVTWMEVMVGTRDDLEAATRSFLKSFEVIIVDALIAERAVNLRRSHRIKLPDAIVWATAHSRSMIFVTRDARDFQAEDPGVRMPYNV